MWDLKEPEPVKLIVGVLACDGKVMSVACEFLGEKLGEFDLESPVWEFTQTAYYRGETGENILRKFVSFGDLIDPGELAGIKIITNEMERELAGRLDTAYERPVNYDPGIIEPSKLVLASAKNFAQRIYIGNNIWAELTLMYNKGRWQDFIYTYPDYKQEKYHRFFSQVRQKLVEQRRNPDSSP